MGLMHILWWRHGYLTSLWDHSVVKGQRLSGDHVILKHDVGTARMNDDLSPIDLIAIIRNGFKR